MAKSKIHCPKCHKQVSRQASACPACGAELQPQVERRDHRKPTAAAPAERKAMLYKVLIIGVVCAVVFGFLGFGVQNMSGGALYSLIRLLNLNNPGISFGARVLFFISLPAVIIPFALLQQEES